MPGVDVGIVFPAEWWPAVWAGTALLMRADTLDMNDTAKYLTFPGSLRDG